MANYCFKNTKTLTQTQYLFIFDVDYKKAFSEIEYHFLPNNCVVCRINTIPGVTSPVHCIDLGQVAPESASRPHLYPAHRVQTSCDLPKHRKKHQQWHLRPTHLLLQFIGGCKKQANVLRRWITAKVKLLHNMWGVFIHVCKCWREFTEIINF